MSRDLIGVAHQVLSSNELEIQELVNIISAARYLDENQKNAIIEIFGLSAKEKTAKADKQKAGAQKEKDDAARQRLQIQKTKEKEKERLADRDKKFKERGLKVQ